MIYYMALWVTDLNELERTKLISCSSVGIVVARRGIKKKKCDKEMIQWKTKWGLLIVFKK